MNHWDHASDCRSSDRAGRGRDFFGRSLGGRAGFDRWAERTRLYLKTRTADHWLMFIGGLVIGALLA